MVNLNVYRTRDKVVAIVDIVEGRASVCIVSCPKNAPSTVLAHGHSGFSLDEKTPDQEISGVSRQIADAGAAAMKMYTSEGHRAPITSAYAIVHAPWVRSEEVRTSAAYERETRIYDSTIGHLAQQALGELKEIDKSRFYEACVTRVLLNGYPSSAPEGKSAKDIQVVSLVSDCEPSVKSAAKEAISKLFPVADITWRTGARALLTVLRDLHAQKQFIIVDMNMSATHLVSVRSDGIMQRIVREGVRTIVEKIAPGKLPEDTLTNMRLLSRDACSTDACEAVQKALVIAEPDLVRVFGEAIGQIAANERVPNDLFLIAHGDMEPWLTRFFARIDFSQFTVTALPIAVHVPSDLDLSQYVSKDFGDSSLALGVALVNIEARD